MNDFVLAHASGTEVDAVVRQLGDRLGSGGGHTLGFVYAASPLAPHFATLVEGLRCRTGIPHWIGTVGHGVAATGLEHWGQPAAVAMGARLPEGSFELLGPLDRADQLEAPGMGDGALVSGFGIVHGDPRNGAVPDIVAALARRRSAYLVGGLSSANAALPQALGQRIVEGGVSGVMLGGRLSVAVGLTQGCTPVGPTHEITRGEGQLLVTLDGRRAYDVLCEDIGIAEGADPRPWLANIHPAFPVAGSNEADYVVRNLVGIDPRRGLVAVAETVSTGDRIMFVRRDRASAEKDMARMLAALKTRVVGQPRAGLYYSCVARGPHLFERQAHEMQAISEVFGDIPVAGFFGNGEISSDRVYGYTGVLTLFS